MPNEKFKCFIYTNGRSSYEMIWPHGSMRLSSHITFKCIRAWHFVDSVYDNDIHVHCIYRYFWLNKTLGSWPISQEMCNIRVPFYIYHLNREAFTWKSLGVKWELKNFDEMNAQRMEMKSKEKNVYKPLKVFPSWFFGKRYCLHFFSQYLLLSPGMLSFFFLHRL